MKRWTLIFAGVLLSLAACAMLMAGLLALGLL
jgi:hypothetical protein